MPKYLSGLVLLAALLPQAGAAADGPTTPRQWLERMSGAAHGLNYEGTFVYLHDGQMQTMRIVHAAGKDGEKERLQSLTGPSREVIRDKDKVTCILPDDNEIVVEHTGPARLVPPDLANRLESLEKYYSFTDNGDERIAGVAAHRIRITPRDGYRYGHVFWLARDNGLLLRSVQLNEESRVVEQLMFTSVNFYDVLPQKLLESVNQGRDTLWQRQGQDQALAADGGDWVVGGLPPGFTLNSDRRHLMPGGQSPVEHLVFSDGLASVSVFVETEMAEGTSIVGPSRTGAVNAYGKVQDGHHITVVGEVPAVTVRQIAESVTPREAPHD